MNQERINSVLKHMQEGGMDQMIISEPCSIWYLTGVDVEPGERLFALYINTTGKKVLFLNDLYTVHQEGCEEIWFNDTDDSISLIASVINQNKTVGIDKEWTARFLIPLMEKCPNTKFELGSKYVDDTRGIKDDAEIECMIENSLINDEVMKRTKAFIKEGMTEKQVEAFILEQYKELGCQSTSFPPICSFAGNGADPHHMPDDTILKKGDSIVLDIGGRKDRYCSDMTRTYFCKEANEEFKKVHDICREANERAEAYIKPGVRLCDIDAMARDYITEKGYGQYFTHRLGHFIGQTDHEFGDVSSTNMNTVKPGMIFSIEPGIYLPDQMGVRVEDLVLVTEDGCQVLNHVDKKYDFIG
jgi:Xaa-Pro aminopeptidase